MIGFSAGFMRNNGLTPENAQYARFGYAPDIRCIGVDLLAKDNGQGECLKLSWSKKRSNASCPIRSLLGYTGLTLNKIAVCYENKRLQGPLDIPGFSSKGFLREPI